MKLLIALIFALAGSGIALAQTCTIPSLRGLRLGMSAQAIDTQLVAENDIIYFDDVQYKLTFTGNRLVRIDADYAATDEWTNIKEFSALYAKRLSLNSDWKSFVENEMLLKQLEREKAELSVKFTSGHFALVAIEKQLRLLRENANLFVQCPQFKVTIAMMDFNRPHVTLRLTNRSNGSGKFEP